VSAASRTDCRRPSGNVFRFVNDSIDGRAIDPFGLFSEVLEHLFQPLHMIFGLLQVALEAALKLGVRRLFHHFGQRLNDLLFRVIDVAECMQEEIVHRFNVSRKQSQFILLDAC
jgi:hypothetical protein